MSAKFGMRVDARDVLDPNGKTKKAFRAHRTGRFRRLGPNPWDDYIYERDEGGPVEVLPGIKIQLEPAGTCLRVRSRGTVVVVEWAPTADELKEIDEGRDPRVLFLERYIALFGEAAGMGAAAFIASKLRR